jgi:SAM-dependent methyltransferase
MMRDFSQLLNERLPAPVKVGLRRAAFLALRLYAAVRPSADIYPPNWMPLVGSGDFRQLGLEFLNYFTTLGGLRPTDHVLDVGCGVGRMAVPLTTFLDSAHGRYAGFDIEAEAVDWCLRQITRRFPHFEFRHHQAANPNYVQGQEAAQLLPFPCPDQAFDFAIVTSVFTHLLPAEVEHYLRELARVMRPGGRCFMTFFLLNAESEALIAAGQTRYRFVHDFETHRVINPRLPQAAVAYPEARVRGWLAASGLALQEPIHYGNWCARPQFVDGQDIVIAKR